MGNVEGQELDLENLTPEQRLQLQQQHELKLQQQQLLREQQQLQQRMQQQQQQQQGRLHQQTTDQSKSQAILRDRVQPPQQNERSIELEKERDQTNVEQKQQPTPQQGTPKEPERLLQKESQRQSKEQAVEQHPPYHQRSQQNSQLQQTQQQSSLSQNQPQAGRQEHPQQPHRTQQLQHHLHRSQLQQRHSEQRKTATNTSPPPEQPQNSRRRNESPVNVVKEPNASIKQQPNKNLSNVPSDVIAVHDQLRESTNKEETSVKLQQDQFPATSRSTSKEHKSRSPFKIIKDDTNKQTRNNTSTERNRAHDQQLMTSGMENLSEKGSKKEDWQTNKFQSPPPKAARIGEDDNRAKSQGHSSLTVGGSSSPNQTVTARNPSPSRQHPQQLPIQQTGSPKSDMSITSPSNVSHSPMRSPMKSPMRSPMMPPAGEPFEDPAAGLEADLSQLTEEERAHILAVLDRARQLQEKDENRVRDMEYHMDKIEREISDRGYQSDSQIKENGSCHICNKSFRRIIEADCIKNEHENKDCGECGQTVCAECGSSVRLSDDEKEGWLCDLCHRRRRFLVTSGFWHKYYSQIQPKTRKSRRSSLDEAFLAIRPPTKSRHRLVRTASYSMVDDMRKTLDDAKAPTEDDRVSDESKEFSQDTNVSLHSDELREEELLLLSRRSRDRSPEYERRTSAGQEEVLRDLRREERGFLISDNTIEMDPIDADHVEDLSEGPDEEEMMRQLMEMADGVDDDFGSLSDHSSSSGIQSHYFLGENDVKYGEHQEILETTQQIAKFTESRNLSDYDLHEAATREEDVPKPAVDDTANKVSNEMGGRNVRRDTPAVQALEETIQVLKNQKSLTSERLSSSLESSPAHGVDRYQSDSIIHSSSIEQESDMLQKEISNLKHFIDVSSHSDSEIEQRREGSSKRRRKKGTDGGRGGSDSEDVTVGTDKFLSVEDLRDVGVDDMEQSSARDFLVVPNHSRNDTTSTFESKGNRPPAAGRGSGSNRRKKGKKYLESPLSPIRDDEVETKTTATTAQDEKVQKSEKADEEKFVYPPDSDYLRDEDNIGEYVEYDEEEEDEDMEREMDREDEDEDYLVDEDDAGSSYLTSPGGLETVMEEQEEQFGDDAWTSKRNYAYGKNQRKRIVTVGTSMIGEEIEDSSPEESKQVLRLQEAPPGKRRSSQEESESTKTENDEERNIHRRDSPDNVPPERRMEKVHSRRSPELRQDDRKDPLAKDRPPLSRVVESSASASPISSPVVSTRFRFSPPITPKLCSTGKTFPEATFPKDLTPTDETAHHEIVDENRNEIVDRQETTPTNEIVGFVSRGHQSPVVVTEKTKHSRKRHAVSTQTEKRKSHREISTQTKSEAEVKRYSLGEKATKSLGVQAGDDLEMFLPRKLLVDVGVETESDVSSTSSPVSFASSRSVGIETDSRDPNFSSGMSSPVSDVGNDRFYTETAVQTLSESFAQTDPMSYDKSDFGGPPYYGMDRSTHTSPSLSYQATQDPKVAQALRAVLGDYPPPMSRSYGMQASAGASAKLDETSSSPYRGNGINHMERHITPEESRSYGMQTSPLKQQVPSLVSSGMSPTHSIGLSRPTSVSSSTDYVPRRNADGLLHRETTTHTASVIPDHLDTRISQSDTESIDSDLGTPRIRRRLPHVPAGSSPSASPVLGRTTTEDTGDLQSEIELDKVKGLLSRKAIQLEMERRKHELDEMTSKICSQNLPAGVTQEHQKHRSFIQQKYRSDGSLSDSDVVINRKTASQERPQQDRKDEKAYQVKPSDSVERGRKEGGNMVAMGLDKEKYVQFSKSEEDIIREIERQVTQATGKSYDAFDQGDTPVADKPKRVYTSHSDHEYERKTSHHPYDYKFDDKMSSESKNPVSSSRDQYETELESQKYWDIDTSPVHTTEELKFPERDPFLKSRSELYPGESPRMSGSSGHEGSRREAEGPEWIRKETRRNIPQLIKDNQNEVDRLSREGEEIERRIKELTALEEKLETDYQQYRTRVVTDHQPRGNNVHPETLADYILKSHEPALRFEKTTDGQYDYTTAHWSNSDESLSGSGGKLASSLSESRVLPARPLGDGPDDREMEGAGLILPLEESSDFDGDLSSGSPASQKRDAPREVASGLPSMPKRDLPAVTVHSETRQKQARQLPIPKMDSQHMSRSEGHRAHPSSAQQPPVPRRSRGERTSNIFHLKRNSNGPSSGSGSGGDLGLRVVGGKRMPGSNQLVAYITDVVEGGAAQKAGLREGDQVLEWCGTPLTGKTFEEVQLIMRTARKMADVTVKCGPNLLDSPRYRVQRPPGREVQRSHHHSSNPPRSSSNHRREPPSSGHRGEHPPRQVARPTSDAKVARITGELQVRLAYDAGRGELRVDVLRGRGLVGKTNDGLADPFVVVRLLPMKSSSDEKRTACVPRTLTPEWNQTLLFRDLRASELLTNHSLELTIWSSSRNSENFMGKVIFNLSDTKQLDNRVHWYRLMNGSTAHAKSHKNIGFV